MVHFHKMHGAGNDFVLIDLRRQQFEPTPDFVRRIGHRRTGVGCDQVLILREPERGESAARFEVWNADGGRAEQCGNGVRCIGLFLRMQGEVPQDSLRLDGPVAEIALQILADGTVRVDMGPPDFSPRAVPIRLTPDGIGYALRLAGEDLEFRAVSMGNPHAVILTESTENAPVAELGPALSAHPAFPEGCNVGFAEVADRHTINLRVYERGAGETRACGSGACAAFAVLNHDGLVADEVQVIQAGGSLIIGRDRETGSVQQTGPAAYVFEGKYDE